MSSVLAMMYLVLFGSLAAAMAVVAQSNLRTADSSLKVSKAMSAAETGLVFGSRRLASEIQRFVVTEGVIDVDFAQDLWVGSLSSDDYEVLPPEGYAETTEPSGLMQALFFLHDEVDTHWFNVDSGDSSLPSQNTTTGVLICKPIALGLSADDPYFRLRYEVLADRPAVRITSIGVDGDISREVSVDFALTKKIKFAAVSPNRIMIGKNVMVLGPIGSRYGVTDDNDPNPDELDLPNGDPIVLRSDFYDLNADLDDLLDVFFDTVADYDVDGDNRLRPGQATEAAGLALESDLVDYDGNEYVDDFDLFLAWYDEDLDGRVVYDQALAVAAGLGTLDVEYGDGAADDTQLMTLIDLAIPDRNGDGTPETNADKFFGWSDGVIDVFDRYAKVDGQVRLAVLESDWELYHGEPYQTEVQGPILTDNDVTPIEFGTGTDDMLEIATNMFSASATWYEAQVPNSPVPDLNDAPQDPAILATQGVGGTYYAPGSPPAGIDEFEGVPFGSPGAYDYYRRPVYENYTFTNVRIPRGNNGLFINCTFVGVTFIETVSAEDTQGHWNYTGAYLWTDKNLDGLRTFDEMELGKFRQPGNPYTAMTTELPGGIVTENTRLFSNNIRFESCTFLGTVSGNRIGGGDPDDNTYTHWRNKAQFTGATRFYIDPEDSDLAEQPDVATLKPILEAMDADDLSQLARSSILLPGWSVDAGSFDAFSPRIKLKGTIVAGVMDIRGRADIDGTLLMTYRPVRNEGPLLVMGSINVDKFNTTIGYFSSIDGDSEGNAPEPGEYGEIRLRYDPDALLPDGIPWKMTAEMINGSYLEGGG
ncbi:MAG: hypothetical protein AB8G96_14785 [Phycisphaerales bacterium]